MTGLLLAIAIGASGDAIYDKRFDTPQTLTAPQRVLLGNAVNWTFGSAVGGNLNTGDLTAMWCSQPVVGTSGTEVYTCEAEELQQDVTDAELLDLELTHGNAIVSVTANGDNWDVVIHYKNGQLVPGGVYRHDLFTEDAFASDLSLIPSYKCYRPDIETPSVVECIHRAIVTAAPSVWADDKADGKVVATLGKVP